MTLRELALFAQHESRHAIMIIRTGDRYTVRVDTLDVDSGMTEIFALHESRVAIESASCDLVELLIEKGLDR